jgi:hypothetical protein
MLTAPLDSALNSIPIIAAIYTAHHRPWSKLRLWIPVGAIVCNATCTEDCYGSDMGWPVSPFLQGWWVFVSRLGLKCWFWSRGGPEARQCCAIQSGWCVRQSWAVQRQLMRETTLCNFPEPLVNNDFSSLFGPNVAVAAPLMYISGYSLHLVGLGW